MQYRHRYYDADLGRFISRDPAGYQDGYCLYCYVGARPLACRDPIGLGDPLGFHRAMELRQQFADCEEQQNRRLRLAGSNWRICMLGCGIGHGALFIVVHASIHVAVEGATTGALLAASGPPGWLVGTTIALIVAIEVAELADCVYDCGETYEREKRSVALRYNGCLRRIQGGPAPIIRRRMGEQALDFMLPVRDPVVNPFAREAAEAMRRVETA